MTGIATPQVWSGHHLLAPMLPSVHAATATESKISRRRLEPVQYIREAFANAASYVEPEE